MCTANICRSPYAAAAIEVAAADAGVELLVTSAGVRVDMLETTGYPTCEDMPYDMDRPSGWRVPRPAEHGSIQVDLELVRSADMILVFEPTHRAHIVNIQPRAQLRTYSVMQMMRLADAVATEHWPEAAPEPTGDVLRDLNLARSWAPFSASDAVPDPHGHGIPAHVNAADVIDSMVANLIRAIVARNA